MDRSRRMQALWQHLSSASATTESREVLHGTNIRPDPGSRRSLAPHPGRTLTDDEKRTLYHNGFVIIRDVVRKDVVQRIHDEIENSPTNSNGRHSA